MTPLRAAARTASRVSRRPDPLGRGAPWPLAVPAAGAVLVVTLPVAALLLRAPWARMPHLLGQAQSLAALRLSLLTTAAATALSLVLGIPLAWLLARPRLPGAAALRALVTLPLVLPPVVGGVALLLAFGRRGVVGRPVAEWSGFSLPFTTAGVVVAEAFVAMPFLVVTLEGAFRSVPRALEEAAAVAGAGRWTAFRRVTLPLVAPGLLAGTVLCWARALGEFGATITFAGNLPEVTQTLPLAVYVALESDPDAAIAMSVLLLAVSVTVLALARPRHVPR